VMLTDSRCLNIEEEKRNASHRWDDGVHSSDLDAIVR